MKSWACGTNGFPLEGVQFHPESFLTLEGIKLLKNFLERGSKRRLLADCHLVPDIGISSHSMLTVAEALAAVLDRARSLPPASCRSIEALGCVLAEDVVADVDSPPFDKALVDGYAVRSTILLAADRWLALGETIMAGQDPSRPLGGARRPMSMTGRPIPPGMRRGRDARADATRSRERWYSRTGGQGRPKPAARAAGKCGPARWSLVRGSILQSGSAGRARFGRPHRGQGRAAARGRDRAHRRRAGRAGPGAGTGPDP